MRRREIPATNSITAYIHCAQCLKEITTLPQLKGASPRAYSRLEIGWTAIGLQIRCVHHDKNVAHIDFENTQHPANTGPE